MKLNIAKEVAALNRLTTMQLREKFAEVFGERTAANNRTWLVRRIEPLAANPKRRVPLQRTPLRLSKRPSIRLCSFC
jgi:hypothetical protein